MDIEPYVRFAMYDRIGKGWKISRSIWDYEIIYIGEGKMNIGIGNDFFTAEENDIVFLRPNIRHTLTNGCPSTFQPHVHFDIRSDGLSEKIFVSLKQKQAMSQEELTWFRKDDLVSLGLDFPTVMKLKNSYAIKNVLFQLIDEYRVNSQDRGIYLKALMIELIVLIKRGFQSSLLSNNSQRYIDIDGVNRFLIQNIDRQVGLDELASHSNISRWYFIKLFKDKTGMTPGKYMNGLRISRAKELITYTNKNLEDISIQMGFVSEASFSRWFKSGSGCSPKDYRSSH